MGVPAPGGEVPLLAVYLSLVEGPADSAPLAQFLLGNCLFAFCWSALLPWWFEHVDADLICGFGFIDALFGFWMVSLARRLKNPRPWEATSDEQ